MKLRAIYRLLRPASPNSGLALLTLALLALGATAHALPGSPDQMMGKIPGTDMTKDEFRARATAQLAAVSLNAHAFFLVQNEFPATFYDLYNSNAWNLDVRNIFSGRTVNVIEFNPSPQDMTSQPPMGLPLFTLPESDRDAAQAEQDLLKAYNSGQSAQLDYGKLAEAINSSSKQASGQRVNPEAVTPKTPGDIFYYSRNGLLQLVMYAPDGTYCEFVDSVPNKNWLNLLSINTSGGLSFPDDMYVNQVLYYAERMLPRHFNLVRFMADREPLSEPELKRSGANERLRMADELGITLNNPYRKRAIKVVETATPGELLASASQPLPLVITLKSGAAGTFSTLTSGQANAQSGSKPGSKPQPGKPKPDKPRPTPPMGGRGG